MDGPGFDELSALARDDPEAFESYRQRLIESAIAKVPTARRQRIRALQWRIEQERRRAPTPLAACVTLSRMMWNSIADLDQALRGEKRALPPPAPVFPLGRNRH